MDTKKETSFFNCLAELYVELEWEHRIQQSKEPEREPGEIPVLLAERIEKGSEEQLGERMERRLHSGLKKRRRRSILKRAAAVILVILIGGTGLLMTNESVRAGIMRLLWRVYPNGVVYYFYRERSQYKGHFRVFEPTWIPEGYVETERYQDEFSGISITYIKQTSDIKENTEPDANTGEEEYLYFSCENERQIIGMTLPIKNAQAQKVIYQGEEAEFYESGEGTEENAFIWRNEYGCLFNLQGKFSLEEFQRIADSMVEIKRVPAVEVAVEFGTEAPMTAEWPVLLDKEGFGYDFWGMCQMDWDVVEKKLQKERKQSYTVKYHYLQENQTELEFRDNLADEKGIGMLRACFQEGKFVIGYYTMYVREKENMEKDLIRLREELLLAESRETTSSFRTFEDGAGNQIDFLKEGEETEDGFYVIELMFRPENSVNARKNLKPDKVK